MRARKSPRRLAAALIVGLAMLAALGAARIAPARSHHSVAVARPYSVGHVAAQTRVAPLSTSNCITAIGIRCYSPGQFERAYNLAGLHAPGSPAPARRSRSSTRSGRRRSPPTCTSSTRRSGSRTRRRARDPGRPGDRDRPAADDHPARGRGAAVRSDEQRHGRLGAGDDPRRRVGARDGAEGEDPARRDARQRDRGRPGVPGDRQGRELRDRQPPRERDLAELRRDRGDVPEHAGAARPARARSRTPQDTTSPCSAPPATRARPTSS